MSTIKFTQEAEPYNMFLLQYPMKTNWLSTNSSEETVLLPKPTNILPMFLNLTECPKLLTENHKFSATAEVCRIVLITLILRNRENLYISLNYSMSSKYHTLLIIVKHLANYRFHKF